MGVRVKMIRGFGKCWMESCKKMDIYIIDFIIEVRYVVDLRFSLDSACNVYCKLTVMKVPYKS